LEQAGSSYLTRRNGRVAVKLLCAETDGTVQDAHSLDHPFESEADEDALLLDALAQQAASGDRAAFEQIYLQLADELYRYVYGQCREAATAEDIVATVFLRAWRSAKAYRAGSMRFRPWVFAIARNELRDYWRSRQRTLPLQHADYALEEPPMTLDDTDAAIAAVTQALAILTPEQRDVVALRYFNHKSHREIATILGKREGAVRSLLLRALRRMRKVMTDAAP
jgi:RNA polymerase sigma-70 factor (ECF subfamily)